MVLAAFLKDRALAMVADHSQSAIMYSYQSDATSYLCQATAQSGSDHTKVLRRGRALEEFLMERAAIYVAKADGGREVAVLAGKPRPLSAGKKAGNLFTALTNFFPMLRQRGHQGIVIFHLGADRAAFEPLLRLVKQRREVYYTPGLGPDLGEERAILKMTDLVVGTGCAAHDVSNALKWALGSIDGVDVLKDLHISIEALRNSFPHLHKHLAPALLARLTFVPPEDEPEVRLFWSAMGVDGHWLELLVELDPHWGGGLLCISDRFEKDPEVVEKVSTVILYLWRWKKFSESRWCTVGAACRALAASVVVGLEEVVARAQRDPTSSNYHLNGFARLQPPVRLFAIVGAIAAYPADALQLELLEDCRVGGRLRELKECLDEEILFVESLGSLVWERLARIVGGTPALLAPELRSLTLMCVYTTKAFIHRRLFATAEDYPWRLAQGDILANLQELCATDYSGTDSATRQIKALLAAGFDRHRLADALGLLRDVPWTTVTVEQAHGSMAVLHKYHQTLTKAVLAHRTMLHQCRALFHPPQEQKVEARLAARVERLQSRRPQRLCGRQMFFRDLVAEAQSALPPGSRLSQSLKSQLMRSHTDLYKALSPEQKIYYDQVAEKHIEIAKRERDNDIDFVQHTLSLHRRRVTEEALLKGVTNKLADSRFSDAELLALGQKLIMARGSASNDWPRAVAEESPLAPSTAQLSALTAHNVDDAEPAEVDIGLRNVIRLLCLRREYFRGCCLLPENLGVGHKAFLFLYATQSPYEAVFMELTRVPAEQTRNAGEEDPLSLRSIFDYHFAFKPAAFRTGRALPFAGIADLWVLEDLRFWGDGTLVVDGPPLELEEFAHRPWGCDTPHTLPCSKRGLGHNFRVPLVGPILLDFAPPAAKGNVCGAPGLGPKASADPGAPGFHAQLAPLCEAEGRLVARLPLGPGVLERPDRPARPVGE